MVTTEKIFIQPKNIYEALDSAYQHIEDFKYVAGGTDIFVNKFQGNETSDCLIDLSGISGLDKIIVSEDHIKISALVKLNDLSKNEIICKEFPVLIEAADSVGSPLIRQTATIGGNILCENRCIYYNQSDWWKEAAGFCLKCDGDICIATGSTRKCYSELVSDLAPALISIDAKLEIHDKEGQITMNLKDVYSGDGVKPRKLSRTSIIKGIILPRNRGFKAVFKKLRLRQSLDFTSLTSSVSIDTGRKIKIVLSGVDPGPVIIEGSDKTEENVFIKEALKKSRSIDNEMLSRIYRRDMINEFISDSLKEILK